METSLKPTIDYSTKDYEGFREDLIQMLKAEIPSYTDFSSSDAGIVIIELLSYGLDILSYYTDKVANEVFLDTSEERESMIKYCKMLNYTIQGSTSSKVYEVIEITPRNSPYVVAKGIKFQNEVMDSADIIIFEVESDYILPANVTGLEKDIDGNYLYKIPLVQGYTISEDVIGTSNGTAYQSFKLNYKPVVSDSTQIFVNEGNGYRLWDKVDSFMDSSDNSEIYKITENNEKETIIEFGSGSSGKIPKIYQNGILATYRVGGGTNGNITANSITKMIDNIAGVVGCFNPEIPYVLGIDSESTGRIKINAPASLRTIGKRAVTCSDYKDLALLYNGVLLANSVESDKYNINLYLIFDNNITITDSMIVSLQKYFDDKKEIGYSIHMSQAQLKPMDITITAKAYPRYKNSDVENSITDIMNTYFALGSFDIGEEFDVSKLITNLITSVSGLRNVNINVNDETVGIDEIASLGTLAVYVVGGV